MENDLNEHLQRLETQLSAIEKNTEVSWRQSLLSGLIRGVGVVLGTALTLILAGWGLSILGIIPGADSVADYLAEIILDARPE